MGNFITNMAQIITGFGVYAFINKFYFNSHILLVLILLFCVLSFISDKFLNFPPPKKEDERKGPFQLYLSDYLNFYFWAVLIVFLNFMLYRTGIAKFSSYFLLNFGFGLFLVPWFLGQRDKKKKREQEKRESSGL